MKVGGTSPETEIEANFYQSLKITNNNKKPTVHLLSSPELILQDPMSGTLKKQMEFQLTPGPPVKSILYPLDLQHIVIYDYGFRDSLANQPSLSQGCRKFRQKPTSESEVASFLELSPQSWNPIFISQQISFVEQPNVFIRGDISLFLSLHGDIYRLKLCISTRKWGKHVLGSHIEKWFATHTYSELSSKALCILKTQTLSECNLW